MMTTLTRSTTDVSQKLIAGVIGGIAGGIVFGIMMAMMGMMPVIAGLVGSQSAFVGFLIHMIIASFIGATFGLIFGSRITSYTNGLGWGALYGAVWWVLDPLLIMPAMMGMPLVQINSMTLMSLAGHLIYGAVVSAGYIWYAARR
jgi:phage shock protein PspC (stress-responsive transcriptional regulator)